jgi:hypothetical protein
MLTAEARSGSMSSRSGSATDAAAGSFADRHSAALNATYEEAYGVAAQAVCSATLTVWTEGRLPTAVLSIGTDEIPIGSPAWRNITLLKESVVDGVVGSDGAVESSQAAVLGEELACSWAG